ncbi:beta-mannosidase [Deinococcus marmoris]|nr:glycoside hydrolase family 2 protein [Deinococcus marmoris]
MTVFAPWLLHDFAPGEGERQQAHTPALDTESWLPVAVPGDVHRTLVAAGRLPEPFYDRNEPEADWIQEREWWYRTILTGPHDALAPDERLRLVFDGVDTYATYYLNGEVLGESRNMFREHDFDVTDSLRPGPNTLAVRLDPPLQHVELAQVPAWDPEIIKPKVAMRKAQFGYGWDWGPVLPTFGLWRGVELRRERAARLTGVQFATVSLNAAHTFAVVTASAEVERFATDAPLSAEFTLTLPSGEAMTRQLTLEAGQTAGEVSFELRDPALWWTRDLGTPALHGLEVRLLLDDQPLDQLSQKVGVRTLHLDQSPDADEPGTRFFRFVLNGLPIFARGANWIPADSFVGTLTRERYEPLIRLAQQGHMNMLRVWGGGVYEHDAFYDLCDELGLLVWQDFMFACAPYPETDELAREVRAEAEYQVRRLRSHASLALWCGNNENQWIQEMRYLTRATGDLYYAKILPEVVAALDGQVPYWPGSPYGGNDHNSMLDGDRHNWDVWHGQRPIVRQFGDPIGLDRTLEGVSYRNYAVDLGRFISEFGMHAAPALRTLRRVIPEGELYHHSPSMDHHNKDNPKNKGDALMEGTTGLPGDLAEYLLFSQVAQAEGLKFGIEHYRRRMPHCSGALIWQLNDCWPVLSWSVIDSDNVPKAGYWFARRAFAPLLASVKTLEDGGAEVWLTSERREEVRDTLTVRLMDVAGQTLWTRDVDAGISHGQSHSVLRLEAGELQADGGHYLRLESRGGHFEASTHFFVEIKDLRLPQTLPTLEARAQPDGSLSLSVTASQYSYLVHFTSDEVIGFSDNFFDLEAGQSRTITATHPDRALRPEDVELKMFQARQPQPQP